LSLKDKRTKNYFREVVQEGQALNKLIIHDDVPFFWDNWDIMHHAFETQVKELNQPEQHQLTQDDHMIVLKFSSTISEQSKLSQEVVFYKDSAKIDFKTNIDWYERRKLLKAYFPLNIRTDFATWEISSGLTRRPIHANTSWDQARLEVCGHKFVDMSEAAFGVSLLNDCKYGFSIRN